MMFARLRKRWILFHRTSNEKMAEYISLAGARCAMRVSNRMLAGPEALAAPQAR